MRFEGPLERNFYQSIDAFDFDVIEVRHQPVCIHFIDTAGRSRRYYPDALVSYSDESGRAPTLYEIKETNDYERNKSEYEMKFAAGRAYSEQMGWDFEVATEKTIRTQKLENALFLRSFRTRSYDELLALRLKRMVQAAPGIEARALAAAEGIEPLKMAECWSTLWALVARGQLRLDPLKPITPTTAIRASKR
ncbi:hypothetical protein ATO7_06310 [Oceanococcus atlanticus]|uniref:TnsA endonuclease N-terminal domain-containing protein n=1 Tax=Oceanococcus atlanticus TaxID=1317117 RepID=A0A1Y1SJL5_9GAMM|nr:TnsA endonuclease N-terminal domain-containing protein [Oceanococcus atlanticus]ORE89471.1 hypothetical protein ATO7_06310 [Oceanococcus atlanticus]